MFVPLSLLTFNLLLICATRSHIIHPLGHANEINDTILQALDEPQFISLHDFITELSNNVSHAEASIETAAWTESTDEDVYDISPSTVLERTGNFVPDYSQNNTERRKEMLTETQCNRSNAIGETFHDYDASNKIDAQQKLRQLFGIKWSSDNAFRTTIHDTPQFMTELYKTVADSDGVTKANNPYNARVVRSYAEKKNSIPGYYLFNVTSIDPNEVILEAELHLFRLADSLKVPHPALLTAPYYLLRVYQVVKEDMLDTPDVHILLNVHYVSAHTTGWQVFNVKRAVVSWLSGEKPNLGLLVTASTLYGNVVQLAFSRRDRNPNTLQPILVLFNGDKDTVASSSSVLNETSSIVKRSLPPSTVGVSTNQTTVSNTTKCQRKELYVDFNKIGWSNFILAPPGYQAYNCRGHCDFPLDPTHKPTNHATVLSLLNELKLGNVMKPCCVPTSLLPISVLYFDNLDMVLLKRYDQMVVKDCGCQ